MCPESGIGRQTLSLSRCKHGRGSKSPDQYCAYYVQTPAFEVENRKHGCCQLARRHFLVPVPDDHGSMACRLHVRSRSAADSHSSGWLDRTSQYVVGDCDRFRGWQASRQPARRRGFLRREARPGPSVCSYRSLFRLGGEGDSVWCCCLQTAGHSRVRAWPSRSDRHES